MIYRFGMCELNTEYGVLTVNARPTPLRPKALQLLTHLLTHHHRMVSKDELVDQVWQGQFISDSTLESTVSEVRSAIGDSGRTQQMIETRYRQGYRFVGDVRSVSGVATENDRSVSDLYALPPPSVAERKVVTLLSCALPPTHGESLDTLDERLHGLYEQIEQTVLPYGGALQPLAADCLLVVFGAPLAQEDHAQRAVLTALALQQRLTGEDSCTDSATAIRVALHTAEVAVGGFGGGSPPLVMGDAVGVAVSLTDAAIPGAIVCSSATAKRVRAVVQVAPISPGTMAGETLPISAYRVIGTHERTISVAPTQRFGLNRFVGRRQELATLQTLTERAMQGQCQVVGVVGEAGMGKSRLVYEYRRRLQGKQLLYIQGHCPSYGQNSPYLPLLSILRQQWSIGEGKRPEQIAAMVERRLSGLDLPSSEWLPYLLRLLDVPTETDMLDKVSPQAIRSRTAEALVQITLHSARQQPLVMEIENLHWIDPSTQEVLEALVGRLADSAVLLLTTYRPGYRPPWMEKSYVSQVSLAGLSASESRCLLQGIVGKREITEAAMQAVIDRGNGNPLFLEEMGRTLTQGESNPQKASVPETVQVVVSSRLDRLPAASKRLLQLASVIGHEVPVGLLQAVSEQGEAELDRLLGQLQSEEFLVARNVQPEGVYRFRHILVQESVYQSLLRRARQDYHQRIAQVLTEHFPELVKTQPEILAHHYTEAGQDENAIRYWQQAGYRALGQSAYREGIAHLSKVLALLEVLPDTSSHRHTELDIQLTLCSAFHVTKGRRAPEVEHASLRARELCEQIGNASTRIQVLLRLRRFYMNSGELRRALAYAEEIPRLAQQTQVPLEQFESDFGLGMVLMLMGALRDGQAYLAKSAALADRLGLRGPDFRRGTGADIGLFCRSNDAFTQWLLGYPDQARERAHESIILAQERDHPYTLTTILNTVARVYVWCRDASAVQERTAWQIALCREHGFALEQDGIIQNGWALVVQGEEAHGLMQMQRIREEGGSDRYNQPWYLALFAEACGTTGKIETGMRALVQARELVEQSEARWCEAELHRLQGELLLLQSSDNQTEAKTCFSQSLDVARRQQAKSWELRAATSLARLWQSQGKRREAYELLAPVYGWFTEGFDTSDLKDAKALLEELG